MPESIMEDPHKKKRRYKYMVPTLNQDITRGEIKQKSSTTVNTALECEEKLTFEKASAIP
jgi:hypothetical protein